MKRCNLDGAEYVDRQHRKNLSIKFRPKTEHLGSGGSIVDWGISCSAENTSISNKKVVIRAVMTPTLKECAENSH